MAREFILKGYYNLNYIQLLYLFVLYWQTVSDYNLQCTLKFQIVMTIIYKVKKKKKGGD